MPEYLPSPLFLFSGPVHSRLPFLPLGVAHYPGDEKVQANGGDATRTVLPCLRLQALGWDIGLSDVRFLPHLCLWLRFFLIALS